MKLFSDLTGALSLYFTGRNSIYGAPLSVYLLPTKAPANYSAVPGTPLAGVFLPISFGQDRSLMAGSNHYLNLETSMDGWRVPFDFQARGSVKS